MQYFLFHFLPYSEHSVEFHIFPLCFLIILLWSRDT